MANREGFLRDEVCPDAFATADLSQASLSVVIQRRAKVGYSA